MGLKLPATFAQIPTLDGKICRMSAKLDAVHSGADRQRFVQITEGWGKGLQKTEIVTKEFRNDSI